MTKLRFNLKKLYLDDTLSREAISYTLRQYNLPENALVHASHCTDTHGCKYEKPDCPVVAGLVKPLFTHKQLCPEDYDDFWD